ncbi:MAG: hypothetical protein H0V82_11420 [Candidatus Protochlamydia sp.]|nr:hypothetical protein [Candidatus Protochlamydia sp.]
MIPIPENRDFYPINPIVNTIHLQEGDEEIIFSPIQQELVLEDIGFFQEEGHFPQLTLHFENYVKMWNEPFKSLKGIFNIKKQFMEPLYGFLSDVAFYFVIKEYNPLDTVDALFHQGCFSPESRELLRESIYTLNCFQNEDEFSCEPHLHFPTITMNQKLLLEKIYWLVLHPLYHFLETNIKEKRLSDLKFLFQDIDLIRMTFDSKYPELPEQLVSHIALHHCQTKTSLETHLHYFKALSKLSKDSIRECYFKILEINLQQDDATDIFQILLNVPSDSGMRLSFDCRLKKLEAGLSEMTTKLHDTHEGYKTIAITLPSLPLRPRYLKPSLIGQMVEGKSYVLKYEEYNFHVKHMPFHPLMEYAIHNLTSRIAGKITPPNLLVRLDVYTTTGKKSYPVIISERLQGKNLSNDWKNITLNQSYTWNFLCSVLTRPGDGKFSNYIIDNSQNLFCVDNQYSFVEPVDQGKIQFCSALFSLFPLESHLDQEVLKEFAALDIDALLLAWIEDVIRKEKEYLNIFPKGIEGSFTPTILFPEGAVTTLYLQFWSLKNMIQQALDRNEPVAVGDLLNELISLTDESIGVLIHKAYDTFHKLSDAHERLHKAILRTDKSFTSIQYCQALKIDFSIEKIEKQRCYSPEEAKKEIISIQNKENCNINFKQSKRAKLAELALIRKIEIKAKIASQEEETCKVILSLAKSDGISIQDFREIQPKILIQTMKYCARLAENEEPTEEKRVAIKFFFKIFIESIRNDDINENHPIQNFFYKKMLEGGYRPKQLFGGKWKLQKILSQDLETAMNQIENETSPLNLKSKEELLLNINYFRGVLAGDLSGNRYKPAGGGVNGAILFRHFESGLKQPNFLLFNETTYVPFLGVFKPHPLTVREFKGWFDLTQWGERIKTVAGMDAYLNHKDPDCRLHNEIFAYELFHIFQFNAYIHFPTTLQFKNKNDIMGRTGSFCAFIPEFDIVGKHISILDEKNRHYEDEELHIWQMSKIFDFLTGNMDGHEGNAFVKLDNNKHVISAVNFDYDKAFAIRLTPKIGNQYKWAQLEISKRNFTEKTKLALKNIFIESEPESKIQMFLKKARERSDLNFTLHQEILLRNRIEILTKIVLCEIQQLSELKKF